ncbi:hypothetical protein ACFQ88_03875 [Paenibacillus sp. NPDC056579]|uniref:hypothetical protein n=1 Tax=Paenibacillus sp. NPDC056579 TaxID=3345871 RepID=UPI0036833138
MNYVYENDLLTESVVKAIHTGDILSLRRILAENPGLAAARIVKRNSNNEDSSCKISRTLLHVVADWPGHFPNGAAVERGTQIAL